MDCISAFREMTEKYNDMHAPFITRPYERPDGSAAHEWYSANPDWFDDFGLETLIKNESVNVPIPPPQ
jgi:hypothetical protein